MNRWLRFRRWCDVLMAGALIVILMPVLFWTAVLVRLGDGAPVLVRLRRVGYRGRTFGLYKFRTMTADGDDGLAAGASITSGTDPRVTPIGEFLRRHRFDELPQLVNVLRGEMGLIGPRPETPEYVDLDNEEWCTITGVRPGIAGLTQLLVADVEPLLLRTPVAGDEYATRMLPLKMDLDVFYANNAGPVLDARIAVALLTRIFLGRVSILSGWVAATKPHLMSRLDELSPGRDEKNGL